jgi:acyl-coenzyme A thioesterase PaaI-like protein
LKIDLTKALESAQNSKWALRKLNFALAVGIPFNSPHSIRINKVEKEAVVTTIPYKRKNMNHIRGIHACGLATAAEFCSGIVLLRKLGSEKYRLIMQNIEVTYTYQAKNDAFARFELTEEKFQAEVMAPLDKEGVVYFKCEIPVHDSAGNLVCTAFTNWQIKRWSEVRTK